MVFLQILHLHLSEAILSVQNFHLHISQWKNSIFVHFQIILVNNAQYVVYICFKTVIILYKCI